MRGTSLTARRGERLRISRGPGGEVLLAGEIDLVTARTLREVLEVAAGEGPTLVVDLTGVVHLQSAGVAVLYDFVHHDLHVRARANSAVAAVLRICKLTQITDVVLLDDKQAVEPPADPAN